jgi:hypothetical protein
MQNDSQNSAYQQTLYLGDRIEVGPDGCFVLSQVLIAPDDTDKMRIAVSVGNGPLLVTFMKEAR